MRKPPTFGSSRSDASDGVPAGKQYEMTSFGTEGRSEQNGQTATRTRMDGIPVNHFVARSGVLRGLLPPEVATAELHGIGSEAWLLRAEEVSVLRAVPKRRREFAAGRSCAHDALRQLQIKHSPLPSRSDRTPAWPPSVVGSITHTSGYAAAAVALKYHILAIGIDAERTGAVAPDLYERICTRRELDWLESLTPDLQAVMATVIFSAKEAFYKFQYALGEKWLDFHDVELEVGTNSFEIRCAKCGPVLAKSPVGQFRIESGLVVSGIYHRKLAGCE